MHLDLLHAPDVLLALDGVLVGPIKSAYVYGKHATGTVYFADGRIVQGRIDFLGHVGDDPAFVDQRLTAIHREMGQGPDVTTREGALAGVLERLALRVRRGEVIVEDIQQQRDIDMFPVGPRSPEGSYESVYTGHMSIAVSYKDPTAVADYNAHKARWAKENPDNVVEYVRAKREGSANKSAT